MENPFKSRSHSDIYLGHQKKFKTWWIRSGGPHADFLVTFMLHDWMKSLNCTLIAWTLKMMFVFIRTQFGDFMILWYFFHVLWWVIWMHSRRIKNSFSSYSVLIIMYILSEKYHVRNLYFEWKNAVSTDIKSNKPKFK